jgi:hypothetical protein
MDIAPLCIMKKLYTRGIYSSHVFNPQVGEKWKDIKVEENGID